jgi:hypothetical protein
MTKKHAETCHFCHYYHFLGTRGGHCTELDVEVNGNWRACQFSRCCLEEDDVKTEVLGEFQVTKITANLPEVEGVAAVKLPLVLSLEIVS